MESSAALGAAVSCSAATRRGSGSLKVRPESPGVVAPGEAEVGAHAREAPRVHCAIPGCVRACLQSHLGAPGPSFRDQLHGSVRLRFRSWPAERASVAGHCPHSPARNEHARCLFVPSPHSVADQLRNVGWWNPRVRAAAASSQRKARWRCARGAKLLLAVLPEKDARISPRPPSLRFDVAARDWHLEDGAPDPASLPRSRPAGANCPAGVAPPSVLCRAASSTVPPQHGVCPPWSLAQPTLVGASHSPSQMSEASEQAHVSAPSPQ
mmetsp:Transcript_75855/g.142973  ORF Transcript_75855/g.142973 Transcript_75855/m.142973 type:complete len:267 (+) Transcript_75855:3-803(+)